MNQIYVNRGKYDCQIGGIHLIGNCESATNVAHATNLTSIVAINKTTMEALFFNVSYVFPYQGTKVTSRATSFTDERWISGGDC